MWCVVCSTSHFEPFNRTFPIRCYAKKRWKKAFDMHNESSVWILFVVSAVFFVFCYVGSQWKDSNLHIALPHTHTIPADNHKRKDSWRCCCCVFFTFFSSRWSSPSSERKIKWLNMLLQSMSRCRVLHTRVSAPVLGRRRAERRTNRVELVSSSMQREPKTRL